MTRILLHFWLLLFAIVSFASAQSQSPDSIAPRFVRQLQIYPQEKIYLHIDKPYYMAGERIWFRAHVADAATHTPTAISRYVYVELIDRLDSVRVRLKIRHDSLGIYAGHLHIPDKLPEGDYEIRAYTHFMLNAGEDYFANRAVKIYAPQAIDNRNTNASDSEYAKKINASVTPDNDEFSLDFYPEGGAILVGFTNRIAFKALYPNGQSAELNGKIYDKSGIEKAEFKTDYQGMGCVSLTYEKGNTYYAMAALTGKSPKRFDLPAAQKSGCMLSTAWHKNNLHINLQKTKDIDGTLYLVAHTRGVVNLVAQWEPKRKSMVFQSTVFPSGVMNLLLLDANLQPLSERLVFVNNDDQAQVAFSVPESNYQARALVRNSISLSDSEEQPLTGNFSVAVTEDKEIKVDSSSNIQTAMLLTSDLRGRIENPSAYFEHSPKAAWLSDLLMMTQGWRRYNVPKILAGSIIEPKEFPEVATRISGMVSTVVGNRAVPENMVMAYGKNIDYSEMSVSDAEGKFELTNCDPPDSTVIMVIAVATKGKRKPSLIVDKTDYPQRTLPPPHNLSPDNGKAADYISKAEQKYRNDNSDRIVLLDEITIAAKRKNIRKSMYNYQATASLTEEEIDKRSLIDMNSLLRRIPGIRVLAPGTDSIAAYSNSSNERLFGTPIITRTRGYSVNQEKFPMVMLNETPLASVWDIYDISPSDVAQIDVITGPQAYVFGSDAAAGVIAVYTKTANQTEKPGPNIVEFRPMGFQLPTTFYSPKYDTPEKRNNSKPDLRTTIYWNPNVETDSTGKASFDFYTADTESAYTVIIEGLCDDGTIIHKTAKIERTKQ